MVFLWFVWKIRRKKNQAVSMIEVIWTRCEIDSIFLADWRVRPLVLYIKKWARFHDINDASKATISSYSLCLMLIHYLQCKSSWSPFIHEPCLFFLAMSVSLVTVYTCICKFSANQIICYFGLAVPFLLWSLYFFSFADACSPPVLPSLQELYPVSQSSL